MLIKPEVKEEIRKAIAKKIKPDQDEIKLHLGTIRRGEKLEAIITSPDVARKLEKITHIVTKYL